MILTHYIDNILLKKLSIREGKSYPEHGNTY